MNTRVGMTAPPHASAGAFAKMAHAESITLPAAGGDLVATITTSVDGPVLIMCNCSFQATVSQGYQHGISDNGGANIIPFRGTQKPTSIVAHTGAPVELHTFFFVTTLTAGAHSIDWNIAQALGTTGTNLSAQMIILYN